MFRKVIVLSGLVGALPAFGAAAAVAPHASPIVRQGAPATPAPLRLAQSGDVEVYYDGRGRRVIVDAFTGQIIAIEQPRREPDRQIQRRAERARELNRHERYYLDDPEDMARLRRDRAREQYVMPDEAYPGDVPEMPSAGLGEPPIRAYPSRPYDAPDYDRPEYQPAQPRYQPPSRSQPEIVAREPVERDPITRAPLAAPSDDVGRTVFAPDASTAPMGPDTVVQPPMSGKAVITFSGREEVAGLQVLLDRAGASPGVIDGTFGSNVDKALDAYGKITGNYLKSTDTADIKKALAESGGDPFVSYTITTEDAAGPYVASVPADYGQKARLESLSYTSVAVMLAERFHMDEYFLKALNRDANFGRPGTIIRVANIGADVTREVTRIVADKGRKQVLAYDAADELVAAYPATIGSSDTPSPTGTHAVSRVAFDPQYTYNPKVNFKQGDNDGVLTIPPGPNGPVGSIWIALDKPTYGIHGTPDPSKIGKTESHGCVRLTNWDARELAKVVKAGVTVEFVD